MSWKEVDIVKLRKQFIEEYLDQGFASFTHLCGRYGISRKTGYKWLDRFMKGGFNNLVDRSSAPINRPNRTPDDICQLIIQTKHAYPYWEPKKILDYLKTRVNDLVVSTEKHIQAYGNIIQESEEATLLKKRYGQLKAKVAVMKAKLAEMDDETEKQVTAYLDESKAWYNSLKSKTKESWNKKIDDMTASIDEVKQAVKSKDKQARAKLADLLERSATMIKDEELAQ